MIFNTHSHINDKMSQIDEIYQDCLNNGVSDIGVCGYDLDSSKRAIKLAHINKMFHAMCGLQPQEIAKYNGDFSDFEELFQDDKCIAIGEIGLDYYYGKDDKEKQLDVFEKQVQIATKYKKTIVIHCRDAYEDTFNILNKYHQQLDGIVLHCYSGSVEMMQRFLNIGCYISLSGVVTFKNAKVAKEVAIACPIKKLLVETDDPFLTPVPFRGQENKPSYVRYVIAEIASLKNMSNDEIANITYNNAKRVFHL